MSEPLRLVVVGVGRMGRIHAVQMAGLDGIELVGISDANPDAAGSLASELGVELIDPAVLPDRDDVEAWVIATPTTTHGAVVSTALAAGVHVLCEKPLTLHPAEDAELAAAARRAGRVLQIGFWRRFSPPWSAAKALIDSGGIGRPLYLRLSQWDADPPPPEFCRPEASGGLAIDCGVHEFDLAEWLTGSTVERVEGHDLLIVDEAVGGVGDVDNLMAVLHLSDGAAATVDLSRNSRYGDDVRTEILGDSGALFVDTLPRARASLATRDGFEALPGSQVDDAMVAGLIAQAEVFHRLVRGEQLDHPDADASRRAVEIGRAVQASAASGKPVAVP